MGEAAPEPGGSMTASASHPDGIPPRIARARSSMAKGPESSETLFGACGGRPPGSKGVGAKLARARSFSALRAVGPGAGPGAPRILPGLLGDLVTARRERLPGFAAGLAVLSRQTLAVVLAFPRGLEVLAFSSWWLSFKMSDRPHPRG